MTARGIDQAVMAGLVATAAVEAVKAVHDLLPSISAVRTAAPGSPVAADMRAGEIAAGITVMAIGGAVGLHTRSWKPIAVALVAGGAIVAFYEWLLRQEPAQTNTRPQMAAYTGGR